LDDIEGRLLNIRDLKPGMSSVNIKVRVSEISEPKKIVTGKGIEHEILEVEVKDETGAMTLVLWDEKVIPLNVGDVLQIENGFVTSFKGEWRINVGKYGGIAKP
jgi:replication factor A1